MNLKAIIKQQLKQVPWLMDVLAMMYNLVFQPILILYQIKGVVSAQGAFMKHTKITIKGKGNRVIIGRKARLKNCKIYICGNNNTLLIGGMSTIVKDTTFYLEDDNCSIVIGENFTMEGGHIASTEGRRIVIGRDCMFSSDVEIRNGDSHPIHSSITGDRINFAQDVTIGDKVWLTAHVRVLKGVTIPDGCIIGNSAVVSRILEESNALYGGNPCVLLKKDITWRRHRQ